MKDEPDPSGEDGFLDPLWSEADWQRYLKENNDETLRFLDLYTQSRRTEDHLDRVAREMGWLVIKMDEGMIDKDILSQMDSAEPGARWTTDDSDDHDDSAIEFEVGPYTVHCHPVFIATRALTLHIGRIWHSFLTRHSALVSAVLAWNLLGSLHSAQMNAIMAIHAADYGDFNLGVCHLKNALSALNLVFKFLNAVPEQESPPVVRILKETKLTLFDLREIWLRVLYDCREQDRYDRGVGGDEFK
jgi:hypothetical protein